MLPPVVSRAQNYSLRTRERESMAQEPRARDEPDGVEPLNRSRSRHQVKRAFSSKNLDRFKQAEEAAELLFEGMLIVVANTSSRAISRRRVCESCFGTNSMIRFCATLCRNWATRPSGTLLPIARWCTSASARTTSAGPRSTSERRSAWFQPIGPLGLRRSCRRGRMFVVGEFVSPRQCSSTTEWSKSKLIT